MDQTATKRSGFLDEAPRPRRKGLGNETVALRFKQGLDKRNLPGRADDTEGAKGLQVTHGYSQFPDWAFGAPYLMVA